MATIDRWATDWPELLVSTDAVDGWVDYVPWVEGRHHFGDHSGSILVALTPEIVELWDEYGYDVPDDSVGPIAVFINKCTADSFDVNLETDPLGRPQPPWFDPFPVEVIGAGRQYMVYCHAGQFDEVLTNGHRSVASIVGDLPGLLTSTCAEG
ncbi:hypothetical protein [Nocardia sp. NPDC058705]|uniref:hypothetical protein n=1 Tax=Nocardia sp. NPDC058705 TaxID=3346609 RepID=UPI0036885A70